MAGDERETRGSIAATGTRLAATLPGAVDLGATRASAGPIDETRIGSTARFTDVTLRDPTSANHAAVLRAATSTDETRIGSQANFVADPEQPVVPVGARIGRFVVLRELGRGAMGVVFAAYDEELDRKVAIKLLHAGHGADASHGRSLLLREAQAMARLSHPNVVAVHEVGLLGGAVFVAMEHVVGVDLQQWLTAQPRPWREALAALRQAGEGLVAAHRKGLVHRDFKPSNVLVGEDERVRVADFGLAAQRSDGVGGGATPALGPLTATIAGDGALIGTPLYMAPELLRGAPATASSDQYAFCVALYEALFAEPPFHADDLAGLRAVVEAHELPAAPPRAGVPTWLYAAVRRGLALAPEDRWASLAELVELLARDPEAERAQRRRRALQITAAIVGTAAIIALLVLGAAALRRYDDERRAEARLESLREQVAALRARGELDEAARLLHTFVTLPENRGTAVIARAHLDWAATQTDHAAATDAYASAYVAARSPDDSEAALRGLVSRLYAGGKIAEAAAALAVLDERTPDAGPELQDVRVAAALTRRDLRAAAATLAGDDPDGWAPVLTDLSQMTEIPADRFGAAALRTTRLEWIELEEVDFDGDGRAEVVAWTDETTLSVLRRDPTLTPLRTLELGPASLVQVVPPVVAGAPLIVASYAVPGQKTHDLRVMTVAPDGALQLQDSWEDSRRFHAATLDFAGDGARELYIGTEAYARRFWRMQPESDGTWSRRPAHRPTDAVHSDLSGLVTADLEGDGRPELVVAAGPWKAYDLRVFKPTAAGELDLVARQAFGSFLMVHRLDAGDRDVVVFQKLDDLIAPNRFPPERPLGEPAGLYMVGLGTAGLEVLGHLPTRPENGPHQFFGRMFPGDLDGDGHDELVVELVEQGLMLLRWRPDETPTPLLLPGLVPLLVADLDDDGTAEIVVGLRDEPGRFLALGTGATALPPLPPSIEQPRPLPPGVDDPAIANAWTNAEQLVTIGLPGRTAAELAAIARLAGPVAPDMLLRTAELHAAVGDDVQAAEHFVAAATRPDLMSAALAGAAQARLRLAEFPAAEALTRRRLAVAPAEERAAIEAELTALAAATAPRPELLLRFHEPLDPRWQIHDPVAVRRDGARAQLSVWAAPTAVLAEFPVVWDGGPAALEVELTADTVEWGAQVFVEVTGQDDRPWLIARVGGHGQTEAPRTAAQFTDDPDLDHPNLPVTGPQIRGRVAVFPAFDRRIRETTLAGASRRTVTRMGRPREPLMPPPGPLRLRIRTTLVEQGYLAHVGIEQIRLTGFTAGEAAATSDPAARLLVEGELAGAIAALADAPADSARAVWRIDAQIERGEIAAATRSIAALLAAAPEDGPVWRALYQRLRRGDPVALLAARPALGPRMVEVLLLPGQQFALRPADVAPALLALPPLSDAPSPRDPAALQWLVLTEFTRGLAHEMSGQHPAARAAYTAALARLTPDRPFPLAERLRSRLLEKLLLTAVALGDRDAAMRWVRAQLAASETPYLVLERMQANAPVQRLLGPAAWATLLAEVRASRP